MEGFTYFDVFATKGIEYLIVIVFLIVLIRLWKSYGNTHHHSVLELSPYQLHAEPKANRSLHCLTLHALLSASLFLALFQCLRVAFDLPTGENYL